MKTANRGARSVRRHSAARNRKPTGTYTSRAYSFSHSKKSQRGICWCWLCVVIKDPGPFHAFAHLQHNGVFILGLVVSWWQNGCWSSAFKVRKHREGSIPEGSFVEHQCISSAAKFLSQKSFGRLSVNSLARTGFFFFFREDYRKDKEVSNYVGITGSNTCGMSYRPHSWVLSCVSLPSSLWETEQFLWWR